MDIAIEQAGQVFAESATALGGIDMRVALEMVKADLGAQTAESFEEKHDPDGEAWAPQKHDYGNPLMVRTGLLYLAVGDQVESAMIADNEMILPPDSAALPEYAEYHTTGTGKMPARPFNGFGESTIEKAIEHGIEEGVRQLMEPWA